MATTKKKRSSTRKKDGERKTAKSRRKSPTRPHRPISIEINVSELAD